MFINPFASMVLLSLVAPAAALLPAALPIRGQALSQTDVAALHASFDPSLGSLRAGRVDAPAALGTHERCEFAAAQDRSHSLAALRAGFEPTDNEWKWLAIGGGIVLLIVLI